MANGRSPGKNRDTGRDPGGFVALPWSVLDSLVYLSLSAHAKALLLEVARQYHRDDNGRMLLSRSHLKPRGWNSADTITKAKRELLAARLIFETVKGRRPNRASWYAVTWRTLDKIPGFDFGVERAFERGAYRKSFPIKNASLKPSHGTGKATLAPPHGTETTLPVPPDGTIRPILNPRSVPPDGHPLEVTISGAGVRESPVAKPMTCQHAGCATLTLGREFCAKHRHPTNAQTAAQRHTHARPTH